MPVGFFGVSQFDYGGTALGYNPARNSLFMVGHDWQQFGAEVSIPQIRKAATLPELDVATVLQPFSDLTEGQMFKVGDSTNKIGGILPYKDKLVFTAYRYYDGDGNAELSHFVRPMDLSVTGQVTGPFKVGNDWGAGFYAGYLTPIPDEFQSQLGGPVLNGQCCLSIISRTSSGPCGFAIDPAKLGKVDPLPSTPLVVYPLDHPLAGYTEQNNLFNASTLMAGAVFPDDTHSVLFFGRQGLGPYCYGEGPDCGDVAELSKGPHLQPYVSQVWAFDAFDLVAVAQGKKQPWDVRPYATWTLDLPFPFVTAHLNSVAIDQVGGRIFVSQDHGDDARPLIHVFKLRPES